MTEDNPFADRVLAVPGHRIDGKIGQGSIAVVYRATRLRNGATVAIKMLRPSLRDNRVLIERLLNEARAAARLDHPGVVKIHEVIDVPPLHGLTMEFLTETLADRIEKNPGRMSPRDVMDLIARLASALDHAHRRGTVHRDIKPSNIMFRRDGTPVLVDFGLAKLTQSLQSITKSGLTVGTPDYMSPEQIQGTDIDGRSDIYSLGVVFFELLTGRLPYRARNYVALALKHLSRKVPRLPRRLKRFQPLLEAMMAKDRNRRLASGEAVVCLIHSTLKTS